MRKEQIMTKGADVKNLVFFKNHIQIPGLWGDECFLRVPRSKGAHQRW